MQINYKVMVEDLNDGHVLYFTKDEPTLNDGILTIRAYREENHNKLSNVYYNIDAVVRWIVNDVSDDPNVKIEDDIIIEIEDI